MQPNEFSSITGGTRFETRRGFLRRFGATTAISAGALGIGSDPVLAQSASTDSDGITKTDATIESGGITIHLSLYEPQNGPHPAVMVLQGGVAQRDIVDGRAKSLANDGYVVLTYDPRGIAPSGGHWDPGGEGDIDDISALIDFLAGQSSVQTDAAGDPHVGMEGVSGGGWRALRAASQDDRIDAISGAITPYNVGSSFVRYNVLKWPWMYFVYFSIRLDHVNPPQDLLELTQEAIDTKEAPEELVTFFDRRSPKNGIGEVAASTLILNGWHDRAFPPKDTFSMYRNLIGADERRLVMVDFIGHDFGGTPSPTTTELGFFRRAREDWFAKTLNDEALPSDSPVVGDPIAFYHTQSDSFETHTELPTGSETFRLSETAGPETTKLTTDGKVQFDFPVFDDLELAGVSHLSLDIVDHAADPHLFVALADVPPATGRETETLLIKDQIAAREVTADGVLKVDLNGVRHTIESGHSLRLVFTLNDDDLAGIEGSDPIFTDGLWVDSPTGASLTFDRSSDGDSRLEATTK